MEWKKWVWLAILVFSILTLISYVVSFIPFELSFYFPVILLVCFMSLVLFSKSILENLISFVLMLLFLADSSNPLSSFISNFVAGMSGGIYQIYFVIILVSLLFLKVWEFFSGSKNNHSKHARHLDVSTY